MTVIYILIGRYRDSWLDRQFRFYAPVSVTVFVAALFINFWAIKQASSRASNAVTDIILSNTPVFDVDRLFVYSTFFVIALSAVYVLMHPKKIPFALHSITLFILIRSAFTLMTHLGTPEAYYASDFSAAITNSFFGADQFFSGHTGMPFLGALMLWKADNRMSIFLFFASLFFAVVVLLGHIHYTIDVMSAFFITYGIYRLALWLFPREHALFLSEE